MAPPLIYWNLVDASHVPEGNAWLSEEELQQLQSFRFEKRRKDWLLGRWTAKRLIQSIFSNENDLSIDQISIKNESSGAPYAMIKGERIKASLSISHRENLASTAFGTDPDISIGIDLEEIESKSRGFIEDYFTIPESEYVFALPPEQQALAASLLWSGREAIVKALQIGLRVDTRQIALNLPPLTFSDDWQPIEILQCPAEGLNRKLFWRKLNHSVVTLAIKHNQQENDFPSTGIQQIL